MTTCLRIIETDLHKVTGGIDIPLQGETRPSVPTPRREDSAREVVAPFPVFLGSQDIGPMLLGLLLRAHETSQVPLETEPNALESTLDFCPSL